MKYPMHEDEYNAVIGILNEAGLLNPLLPRKWEEWHANEQQCLYEAFEYMVMPYEKDLVAVSVRDAEEDD